ncbi:MAG: hypothetical protein ACD_58C00316G0008 [uncultured bacterium]|nr:MAG: hypothetical protein ACD_58C00316G0008 [uncultured bacterium]
MSEDNNQSSTDLLFKIGCPALLLGAIFLITGCANINPANDKVEGPYAPGNTGPQLTYPSGNSGQLNPESKEAKDCLKEYIKSVAPNSPLIDKVDVFVAAGKKYNVNPALMLAIAQQESSFGTTGVATSGGFNYYGITKCSGGFRSFTSWNEAIYFHAEYLKTEYIDKGFDTIEKMGDKYCPAEADPLNQNWIPGVTQNLNAITSKCPQYASAANSSECVNGYRKPIVLKQTTPDSCTKFAQAMTLYSLGFNFTNPTEILKYSFRNLPPEAAGKVTVTGTNIDGAIKALKEGKPVVFSAGSGLFSRASGHYLTLWGIYPDGTIGAFDSAPRDHLWGDTKNRNILKEYRVTVDEIRANVQQGLFIFERKSGVTNPPQCETTQTNQNADNCSDKTPSKSGLTWVELKTADNQSKCVQVKNNLQVINSLKQAFANISGFTIKDVEGFGTRTYNSYHPTGCAIDINKSHNPYFVKNKPAVVTGEIPYTSVYATLLAFNTAKNNKTDQYIITNDVISALRNAGWSHPYDYDWQHFQTTQGECHAGQ